MSTVQTETTCYRVARYDPQASGERIFATILQQTMVEHYASRRNALSAAYQLAMFAGKIELGGGIISSHGVHKGGPEHDYVDREPIYATRGQGSNERSIFYLVDTIVLKAGDSMPAGGIKPARV